MQRDTLRIMLPAAMAVWCAATLPAKAADPVRIGLKVLGDTPVTAPLRSCLEAALSHHPGYVLADRLPTVELDVVANVDVDDTVNRAGVSLAVAFVSHASAITLAKALLGGDQPTTNPDIRAAMLDLFTSGGSLERLNVGHLSNADGHNVVSACGKIARETFAKFPSAG
ncbi:hypothetical protein NFI95_01160 [Acetobacteraceae bacterium KSS8]|uniref:Uncharacterized protein n=1 Tax=Endosaccharibacter trunci TaxID=2812733 RepID=A0ABT1W2T1_9PROT|nr:hypothetical protein [Acetobacteraceae bacterium KSS8]